MGTIIMDLVWETIDEAAAAASGTKPEIKELTEEEVIEAAGAVYLDGDEGCAYPCFEAGAVYPEW